MSQPKIIKRYQNRKLYDTESSRYVTLDDIAIMIKNGEDVKVVDNRSKEDLTGITLTQIIYEEEKKQRSILPLDALKKVIRTGGSGLSDLAGRVIQPGLSSIASAREDFEKIISKLVKRGDLAEDEGKGIIGEIKVGTSQMQKRIDNSLHQFLDLVKGISLLGRQVSSLEKQVKKLEKEISVLKKKGVIKD